MTIDDLLSLDVNDSGSCIIDAMIDVIFLIFLIFLRSTKLARWGKDKSFAERLEFQISGTRLA